MHKGRALALNEMGHSKVEDVNVVSARLLPTPSEVKKQHPISSAAEESVLASRTTIEQILDKKDSRLMVIAGPCSIHDLEAGLDYAKKFAALADELKDSLFLVMRVYFSKPRTTVGWKGFINDPDLDDSFKVGEGLSRAREFLLKLAELGIPVGTETLDSITPQYLDDLISWNAIGARTAESQSHREIASGLSTPVGIKNGTDGNVQVAINALNTMQHSHHFLGINQGGQCVVLETRGNKYGHLILRGGAKPNYDAASVAESDGELKSAGLASNIVIDCSHGNSLKDFSKQAVVLDDCLSQIEGGNISIVGVMLESNINEGNQSLSDLNSLAYGVSVTDSCISWEKTEEILRLAASRIKNSPRS